MDKRLKVIKVLIKKEKKCRTMLWMGAKPQGTWGHQGMGLAPTTIQRIRQRMAVNGLIHKPGGCTTTGYAVITGTSKDPGISLVIETMITWLKTLRESSIPEAAIQRAWGKARDELQAAKSRWAKVKGPMSAAIATLLDRGWTPHQPTEWEDREGGRWTKVFDHYFYHQVLVAWGGPVLGFSRCGVGLSFFREKGCSSCRLVQ